MTMRRRGGSPAVRQITEGLAALNAEVFNAIAKSPTPVLDKTMPALTRAADHSSCGLQSRRRWPCRAAGQLAAARAAAW